MRNSVEILRAAAVKAAIRLAVFLSLLVAAQPAALAEDAGAGFPAVRREFRAVWIATVDNIDWPSKRGLTTDEQKAELIRILDLAKELNLNAVVLQVRPQCDALYRSDLEPWSEYLTGRMGVAPSPYYDPLEFAVTEAHARGLLLHAWFNPYRALHPSAANPAADSHVSRARPDLARPYGRYVWLDPGEREVQDYSLKVVLDVVKRYDIDGVHFDDYFYPYAEKDAAGKAIPFPDQPSWDKYVASGGRLGRDDWRRQNVDAFIRRVYESVRRVKPRVLFGVSPFGIWQPVPEEKIKGFNAYEGLYADSRKWLREGWIDYFAPQLYWPIKQEGQSYTALLDWWNRQNVKGRHLWPGNAAYRVGTRPDFPAREIEDQIVATRTRLKAPGNIFFSARSLSNNLGGIKGMLKAGVYNEPALVPPSPWVYKRRPDAPSAKVSKNAATNGLELRLGGDAFLRVIRVRTERGWEVTVLPGGVNLYALNAAGSSSIVVTAVDRLGNESAPKTLKLPAR